jgi:hypothetical protein
MPCSYLHADSLEGMGSVDWRDISYCKITIETMNGEKFFMYRLAEMKDVVLDRLYGGVY